MSKKCDVCGNKLKMFIRNVAQRNPHQFYSYFSDYV